MRKVANQELNDKAINNSLPDGIYLTSPKWLYIEREVIVEGGKVSLVSDGKHIFSQPHFFEVNDILKTIP
jgi:hypothetical protein